MERLMHRRRIRDMKRFLSLLGKELAKCPALVHEAHSRNVSQLHWAVKFNCPEVVDFLLSQGAEINCRTINGVTPLHWASEGRSVEMVSLLLNRGACPGARDRDGKTPLHWAVRSGRTRIVRCLVGAGVETGIFDKYMQTPLHIAIKMGFRDICRLLLEKKVLPVPDCGSSGGRAVGLRCASSFCSGLQFEYRFECPG